MILKTFLKVVVLLGIVLIVIIILAFLEKKTSPAGSAPQAQNASYSLQYISKSTMNGGRVDWSKTKNIIAVDRMNAQRYYEIWTMNPDGSDQQCLTCNKAGAPPFSKGNPAWHPNGRYIVFQAQNDYRGPLPKLVDYYANPGAGLNNDLWVMDSSGDHYWKIWTVPGINGGVLHPHFSNRGDKLLWAERFPLGNKNYGGWELRVADFSVENGVPTLRNVQAYRPGTRPDFYESHGFTLDDNKIIFSGNPDGQSTDGIDIYTMDLATQQLVNLTNSPDMWDEHAQLSPDGQSIVWMSGHAVSSGSGKSTNTITDYWLMDPDGGNKRQLTHFNDPGSPEYIPSGATAGDSSWSPDSKSVMGYVITSQKNQTAFNVRIFLND